MGSITKIYCTFKDMREKFESHDSAVQIANLLTESWLSILIV